MISVTNLICGLVYQVFNFVIYCYFFKANIFLTDLIIQN